MEIADIKALISPNRPGGVSAIEFDRACRMLDDFDNLTREAVTGLVDISRRERARAEAAEEEAAKWRELHSDRDRDLRHEYARAEAAEAFARKSLEDSDMLARKARELQLEINDLVRENAQLRRTAEAEVARLRTELAVTRDLLSDAPVPFQDDVHQPWHDAVCEYLSTLDNSGQDAAGG
jgi:hypothetical protein